jgi:eukaryotic-like serine/threonine-protein kinase
MDRTGTLTPLRSTPALWGTPHFAPDGQRIALAIDASNETSIWIYEWERDTLMRLTTDRATDVSPVWTPDSRRIAFGSTRGNGVSNLYWQRADGTGEVRRLTDSSVPQFPDSWHPSGKFLAFHEGSPIGAQQSLMILPMDGDETSGWKPGKPRAFVGGPFMKAFAMFSPDGRWIAYTSNESGR